MSALAMQPDSQLSAGWQREHAPHSRKMVQAGSAGDSPAAAAVMMLLGGVPGGRATYDTIAYERAPLTGAAKVMLRPAQSAHDQTFGWIRP
jgi:hypothetical protein